MGDIWNAFQNSKKSPNMDKFKQNYEMLMNCSALAMKQTFLLMDQWKKSYFHDNKPFKYWCMFPCEQTNLLGMLAVNKDVILPCFETSHFYNVKYSAVLGIGDKDHIYVFWDIFPFI